MKQYDVVVIGTGLAGLEVARSLAVLGKKVRLVDAKASLADRVHTTGIFVRRTLEDFKFPKDCLGPVVRDVSLYAPNGSRFSLSSAQDEFRVGRMKKIYQTWLNQCRTTGVEVSLNTRFETLSSSGSSSYVRLRSNGQQEKIKTRFTIAADGAQSHVAPALGLSENKKWIVGFEEVYEASAGPPRSEPRFHCLIDPVLAPGYIAWLVDDGEETHLGVGGNPKQFEPKKALAEFKSWVHRHLDFETGRRIEQRGGRIPVGGLLPQIYNHHGMLVGDAAGAVSPLTAGGLDPCLRLSRSAAILLNEYLATGQFSALDTYHGSRLRKRFFKRLLMRRVLSSIRSRKMVNLFWPMLNNRAGRAFAHQIFFGRGSFPDLLSSEKTSLVDWDVSVQPT